MATTKSKSGKTCIFLALYFCCACALNTVSVDEEHGVNTTKCLHDDASKPACKTLEFVSSQIGNNSVGLTIVIRSDLHLKSLVSFVNSTSLVIRSDNKSRTLTSSPKSITSECGLMFHNITGLNVTGIAITNCTHRLTSQELNLTVAIHVHQITKLCIDNLAILKISNGTGLVISDLYGHNTIENSTFSNSHRLTQYVKNYFAGGIHIEFKERSEAECTLLSIKNCSFINNTQPSTLHIDPTYSADLKELYGYGTGGGLGILFMNTSKVTVLIDNCTFLNNSASHGGGLYAHFQEQSTNNCLAISNSLFKDNIGSAGGGMRVGMGEMALDEEGNGNRVMVTRAVFFNNRAQYGGGTSVFAVHSKAYRNRNKTFTFSECTWNKNTAHYSSAVDISPFQYDSSNQGFLPIPKFAWCSFTDNRIENGRKGATEFKGVGTFVISRFEAIFDGCVNFFNNSYTALLLTSSVVILEAETLVEFQGNEGIQGGALAMYGISTLKGKDNCSVVFNNNHATKVGGAIYYQPYEQREFIEGKSCFVEYTGASGDHDIPNFTLTFTNNTSLLGGSAIFSVSFYSCFYRYFGSLKNHSLSDFFEKIGKFVFDDDNASDNNTALATEGQYFKLVKEKDTFQTIPRKPHLIKLAVLDEFNHTSHYTAIGLETSTLFNLNKHPDYYYFSHNTTRLYGQPGKKVSLKFNTLNTRDAYFNIDITLLECPPGYVTEYNGCHCSANQGHTSYKGITKCNDTLFQAYIQRDYWAGYLNGNKSVLYTGQCSFKLCEINSIPSNFYLLPANTTTLSLSMCGMTKKGILCGECNKNYSAYYHSDAYKCGSEELCKYGLLFYILSEIIPVVILFTLIVHFNISFTAGGISGFVFFSQIIVITPTDSDKLLYGSSNTTKRVFQFLHTGHSLIYNTLNFNFFAIDELSFCLWHGAKPMDTLVFKYMTSILTIILVFALIRIMNSQWYMKRNSSSKPRSVLHGLSAFLVLSYSQCLSVTFSILDRNMIATNRNSVSIDRRITVTQHGGLRYFGHDHIPYAIAAIVALISIIILPPLLLLAYPLIIQLLSLCNLSENKIVYRIMKMAQIHWFIPLFDSFQSCYKDRLRFFAGVYFLYKLFLLCCRAFTNNVSELLTGMITTIFLILGIHAVVQPYKQKCHNIIDALLFLNLGIIYGLNTYVTYLATIYDLKKSARNSQVQLLYGIQIVLIYIPILVVILWSACVLKRKVRNSKRAQYQVLDSVHAKDAS